MFMISDRSTQRQVEKCAFEEQKCRGRNCTQREEISLLINSDSRRGAAIVRPEKTDAITPLYSSAAQ